MSDQAFALLMLAGCILCLVMALRIARQERRSRRDAIDFGVGAIEVRLAVGGYGHCERCRETWATAAAHVTTYTEHHGCFPLCEPCWRALRPAERLPYYQAMLRTWREQAGSPEELEQTNRDAPLIEAAVLAGK
jgi:hypothetical protein